MLVFTKKIYLIIKSTHLDPALYSLPTLPNSHAEIPIPDVKGTGDNCRLMRKKLGNKEIETTVHKKWKHRKFLCSFCHVRTASSSHLSTQNQT